MMSKKRKKQSTAVNASPSPRSGLLCLPRKADSTVRSLEVSCKFPLFAAWKNSHQVQKIHIKLHPNLSFHSNPHMEDLNEQGTASWSRGVSTMDNMPTKRYRQVQNMPAERSLLLNSVQNRPIYRQNRE